MHIAPRPLLAPGQPQPIHAPEILGVGGFALAVDDERSVAGHAHGGRAHLGQPAPPGQIILAPRFSESLGRVGGADGLVGAAIRAQPQDRLLEGQALGLVGRGLGGLRGLGLLGLLRILAHAPDMRGCAPRVKREGRKGGCARSHRGRKISS